MQQLLIFFSNQSIRLEQNLYQFITKIFKSCMQILVFVMAMAVCTALNLSGQEQRLYDPEVYKTELEEVQRQAEVKIEQIKAQIKQIHDILDNTQITQSVRLVKLTESMADERDSLYQMQQILKVPFQVRSCKCAGLDDQTRQQINLKIGNISESITNMKNSLRKCTFEKCPRYQELVLELNQEQNYLNIINETVNSECCQSPYVLEDQDPSGLVDLSGNLWKDNLKAERWFYGNISKTQYTLSRFQLATKYNLTSCPLETPYVNIFENICFNCSENQYFSLGDRQCYGCQKDQFFNISQTRCVECPPHQFYNSTLGQCSHCPVDLVLDNETKQCVACSKDSYPDFESSTCIKCQLHHFYSPEQKKCITCNLERGEYLNNETLQCEVCPNASFFSMTQGKCVTCPGDSYFNSDSQKCVLCPDGQHFFPEQLKCGTCDKNYFYNPHVKKCQKCQNGLIYNDVIKACVPDQAEVIGHEKCPADYPYYNKYADKCEKCPMGEYFDFEDVTCKSKHYISICPPQRPLYKQAILSCQPCPKETPQYDPYYHKCIDCPQTKPIFNSQTFLCEECAEGSYYNNEKKECEFIDPNPSIPSSIQCPEGSYYNNEKKECEFIDPIVHIPSNDSAPSTQCPEGSYYNNQKKECESIDPNPSIPSSTQCPEGSYYNNEKKECEFIDPIVQIPSNNSTPSSQCPEGSYYNNEKKECEFIDPIVQYPSTSPDSPEDTSGTVAHRLLMSAHESQTGVSPIIYSSISNDQNYRQPYSQPPTSAPSPAPAPTPTILTDKTVPQRSDTINPIPISTQFITEPIFEGPHELPSPYSVSPTVDPQFSQPTKKFSENQEGKDPRVVAENQHVQINPSTIPILTLKPFSHSPNTQDCKSQDQYMNYATRKCEHKMKKCLKQQKYDFTNHKCVKQCVNSEEIYDFVAKQCKKCGENQYYSQEKHSCLETKQGQVKCEDDEFYSQAEKKCIKDYQKCNRDQFLNTLTGQCERKSDSCTKHQFYNAALHQCQHRSVLCLQHQLYDEETMLCLDNPNK